MTIKSKNDMLYSAQLADTGTRLVAIFIDGIILSAITGLIFGSTGDEAWVISFVMTLGYNWFFWTRWDGQTPGKRLMGIRVVKVDGSAISSTDALIRATGYYVNSMFLMLGWIWALFDEQKRGWHDLFAGTVVVKAE
jgi:uncharacterized RDD family membrane protein YckC